MSDKCDFLSSNINNELASGCSICGMCLFIHRSILPPVWAMKAGLSVDNISHSSPRVIMHDSNDNMQKKVYSIK